MLPDYMVPSAFVMLDSLPLTPNGKLDRRALPAPDTARPDLESPLLAPRTPIEEALAAIWAEVLTLDEVGVHDNFFDLGGDSLLTMKVISRLKKSTGISLEPREFAHQTLGQLASACEERAHRLPQRPLGRPNKLFRSISRVMFHR